MSVTLLSLGSNMGDKINNIAKALTLLREKSDLLAISHYYVCEPFGYTEQDDFVNIAVVFYTELSPVQFLRTAKDIEVALGRTAAARWTARVIDIDILLFDDIILSERELTIPHLEMHKRNFVLIPANEIVPMMKHPLLNKNIEQLLKECDDMSEVTMIKELLYTTESVIR